MYLEVRYLFVKRLWLISFLLCVVSFPVLADDEASNVSHVQTSEYGRCYLKSVPLSHYGSEGYTEIYQVGKEDQLLHRFEWFSQRAWLSCAVSAPQGAVGISVVRQGPWSRGRQASDAHLALAFYFKGKHLRSYSTLDLAGSPENVSASVSHYQVIRRVLGYRWLDSNRYVFEVESYQGQIWAFDPATGARVQVQS